jgi:sodium-independent sulfate anion transporter 11
MALYSLSRVAYYIPNAGLAAIIIHAIADIIASPKTTYKYVLCLLVFNTSILRLVTQVLAPFSLRMSHLPWGCLRNDLFFHRDRYLYTFDRSRTRKLIWILGIYFSVSASVMLMLIRIAKPRSHWIGVANVQVSSTPSNPNGLSVTRTVFVPFTGDHSIDSNPHVKVRHVAPGIFIYRPDESITYPNAYRLVTEVYNHIKVCTRRGGEAHTSERPGDRPWNDPGPAWWRRKKVGDERDHEGSINERKPVVHAIIFDLSVSSHMDVSGVQALLDAKTKVEYWKQGTVEFHFTNIQT